jgi:PAS domain S-box-containing protein
MSINAPHILIGFYTWIISSIYRVAISTFILAVALGVVAHFYNPVVFGIMLALILFGLGGMAFLIRRSSVALDFPGVDRFFQQVPCYLSIQDKNLRIIRTNSLFREDFGNRVGELCHVVYKGSKEVCPNCPVIKTFADGQTYSTEETVITKDRKPAQMIVYTTPVSDEQGNIVGVMEMSTNITEIKELQEQIEASRKEYMNLFERVPCYISILDKDYRIKHLNSLFRKDFGDRVGSYCYEVYHNLDNICPDCHVAKTFEDEQIHSVEKTVVRADGTEARLIVYSSPIYNEKDQLAAVMEMATDITEVKRLQRELIYMGQTIATMAHRIKNILMGLEGGIFVVNTGMEDKDNTLITKGWEMIENNVKNVSRIVKDLLYCSKERELNLQEIDPVPIVKSVYELFLGRAQKEGVGINLELPDSLPKGRFDSEALHSLLTNLVINALDACINDTTENKKDSHRIKICVYYDDRKKHIFEVEDNGQGIPDAVGESIFEDFFSTKGREGTGLGLLVAHRIVEQHGGTITFDSKENLGTTFRAIFPQEAS